MYFALLCQAVFPLCSQNLRLKSLRWEVTKDLVKSSFFFPYVSGLQIYFLRSLKIHIPRQIIILDAFTLLSLGRFGGSAVIVSTQLAPSADHSLAQQPSGCIPGLSADTLIYQECGCASWPLATTANKPPASQNPS